MKQVLGTAMKKYMILGVALCGTVISGVQDAGAGFQFTAPVQQPRQEAVPPLSNTLMPQVPDIQIEGQTSMPATPVTPVDTAPTPLLPTPQPMEQMTPVIQSEPQPQQIKPQTGISSLAPSAPAMTPVQSPRTSTGYEMAVGFGKDLPLVTALRQVVPNNYTYVLDESVPMSQNVSWEGGRPWNMVLSDMISPLGLTSSIQGNRVTITGAGTQSAIPDSTPVPVAEPVVPPAQPIAQQNFTPSPPIPAPQAMVVNPQPTIQFSAPPPAPVSTVVPKVSRGSWVAERGDSLRNVLEEWSSQAGADMFWSSDYDYPLAGDVNISGTFEEAVQNLLRGFEQARPKPIGRLHPNLPHGPAVLVVETRQTLE